MSDFPDLASPWSRVPLVHDASNLFPPEVMAALDARYLPRDLGPVNPDDIVVSGRYVILIAEGANGPEGGYAGPYYLDVIANPTSGGYIRQEFTQFWNGTTWVRVRNGNAWQPFKVMTN